MMISISVSLIWLLSLLAAAVHLMDAPRTPASALWTALAFAATLGAAMLLSPQPNWIGVLVGVGAFWRLIIGPMAWGHVLAGASASLATALQITGGVSPGLAVPLTAAGLAAVYLLRGDGNSARGRTELEVVLVIAALGTPLVGLGANLIFGWHSATMLNREAIGVVAPSPPEWTIGLVGLGLAAGLVRGMWIRR